MRVRAKRKDGEHLSALLKRFSTRVQKSGVLIDTRKRRYQTKPVNDMRRHTNKMYALRLKEFIDLKMKEGWSFEKSYQMGRRYIQELKYKGQ
ncbi:MAG: hypothetical protein UU76_C0012G0018 [Parcubacteria group bacterium GW2011_GWC1_41_7]|nr:MAG: hypothetical protein UU76_C0012G0018 [Parcubacteria group bacterium GW2011_GWC1_41_7]